MPMPLRPVKKLRFSIAKLQFLDLIPYFRAVPGERTEISLALSHTRFNKLKTDDVHNDCIAFSQLLKMKKIDYTSIPGRKTSDTLARDFVVLSFASFDRLPKKPVYLSSSQPGGRRVSASPDKLVELLFLNGFSVGEGEAATKYIRFAGSASMTRNGCVMFVNKVYEPELSERVTLGLEKNGCLGWAKDLIPSKWDAYKGLCLSDGYGLEWLKQNNPHLAGERMERPELHQDTVAVINDMTWVRWNRETPWQDSSVRMLRFTTESNSSQKTVSLDVEPDDLAAERKGDDPLSDGVGFLDPAAARWLSAALCGDENATHTFQVRLPFVKGMLHSVDFRRYLRERGVTTIKDAWGAERSVDTLRIIIPRSMFKAGSWFGKGEEAINRYFENFIRFGHDLFITQRHLPRVESPEPYRLNYEVLQTIGLSEEEFDALLEDNLERYKMLRTDEETRKLYFELSTPEEESDMDEDSINHEELESEVEGETEPPDEESQEQEDYTASEEEKSAHDFQKLITEAVRLKPELVRSQKAKDILADACQSMAFNQILRGRLALKDGSHGESRYLSCDLGRYMDYLVTLNAEKNRKCSIECFRAMSPGEFYAPGLSAQGEYCAVFRTPHYSRNEHLVLRPRRDEQREEYFGHLTGVIMLPAEGFGPQRLGGADFDGDHVAIIDDSTVVGSLERVLKLDEVSGEERDKLGGSGLPFIDIPSNSNGTRKYNWEEGMNENENRRRLAEMELQSFRTGTNNRVGLFSNYAFSHGAAAYGPEGDVKSERMVQCFTALTGLEIDSVKTGIKPSLPPDADISKGRFLTIVQNKRKASKKGKEIRWEEMPSSGRGFVLKTELKNWEEQEKKRKKTGNNQQAKTCYMDRIPERLLEQYAGLKKERNRGVKLSACFPVLMNPDQINPELCSKLKQLNQAFTSRNRALNRKRKPWRIQTVDNDLARVLGVRCDDVDRFEELTQQCNVFFWATDSDSRYIIRNALEHSFELAQPEQREETLLNALKSGGYDPSPDQWNRLKDQFTDFSQEGFALPYIMLRMTDMRDKKRKGQQSMDNPYWEIVSDCSKDDLLSETRKQARKLCLEYYPEKDEKEISRVLAAHLLKNESEGFFWRMLGEEALSFLGKEETP